ncbi:sugar porter family MFS transporter [Sphingomonas koreensis]|nr:sugar porter family MFS transporter [Sphingomonas koreensis]
MASTSITPGSQASTLFYAAAGTAALAGLLFGFDTAVISGVTQAVAAHFSLDQVALGTTVSAALWGTLLGAMTAGVPGDRYGARAVLRVLAAFYVVSGLGAAMAWDWGSLLAFRFIGGLAIGGSSVLAPVYIAEIAPAARRGLLVGMFQLAIVVGILAAYISNAAVGALAGGDLAWRWKLGVAAVPALIFLVLLFRIPHSPRWLAAKGRDDDAIGVLRAIGDASPEASLASYHAAAIEERARDGQRLRWSAHKRPMLLAVLVAAFNQLSGINAILYYLNQIFADAGFHSADLQAIIIGVANLVFTLIGMALIDRIGRKTLLLIGGVGTASCLALAALALGGAIPRGLLLPALIGFIAFFAPSQGAVIWVYISEVFPSGVRARGAALGAGTHWLLNAVIALVFPLAVARLSPAMPFGFFAAMMVLQVVIVALFFPETKGVSLEEMQQRMER